MLHQYFLPELIKMVGKVNNKIVGNVIKKNVGSIIPHFFQIVGNVIRPFSLQNHMNFICITHTTQVNYYTC